LNSPVVPASPLDPIEPVLDPPPSASIVQGTLASDLSQLAKTRLTALVVLTTLAGYALASRGQFDWLRLFHTLLGTTLVAICSSILNQAFERDTDALMRRTELRPLVTRRLPLRATVSSGLLIGTVGLVELAVFVNSITTVLTALTLAVYVLAYTPLKRLTALNTLVGAIPGALPPLIGATAARGHFNAEGWCLFAILAVWQLPHFYAIAWLYRDDYRAAGLRMVSVADLSGRKTAWHGLISALVLLPVSLMPVWVGFASWFYGACALTLSSAFIWAAIRFVQRPERREARTLFLSSIIYLPLILAALALDIPLRGFLGH
jgi:protoheme IX farnesyltransferase